MLLSNSTTFKGSLFSNFLAEALHYVNSQLAKNSLFQKHILILAPVNLLLATHF